MSLTLDRLSLAQRHNVLVRHHGADHPITVQARRALEAARTEATIAAAIESAPALDADTIKRIHALIPAPTITGGQPT